MPPEPDYPAAHSMDADWFAVDKDGHVAIFSTGEAGAVPSGAPTVDGDNILDRLVEGAPPDHPIFDLGTWIGEGDGQSEQHISVDLDYAFWTLMFLDAADPIREQVERGLVAAFPGTIGVAVFNRGLSDRGVIRRLHREGHCLGCFHLDDDRVASRLGLFAYQHANSAENWIAGPYERSRAPAVPLKANQLPTALRDALRSVQIEAVSFPGTERLQPIEHVPCGIWNGCEYLASDGVTIRALPGREQEFRDEYAARWTDPAQREEQRPYRYEPPTA